jgi:hypothetical protein
MKFSKIILTLSLSGCLFGTGLFLSNSAENAEATKTYGDKSNKAQTLVDGKLNEKVKYKVYREGNELELDIIPENLETKEDLNQLVKKMPEYYELLKQKDYKDASITLTFNRPLSVTEFESLVKQHNLSVLDFEIRSVGEDGSDFTTLGKPTKEELIPLKPLEDIIKETKSDFKGVIAARGSMNLQTFDALKNHKDVFLVDLTSNVVLEKVKSNENFKKAKNQYHLDVNTLSVYYYLEKVNN